MKPINVSKSMTFHLTNCGIPKNAISIYRNEKMDCITLSVTAAHGTCVRYYTMAGMEGEAPALWRDLMAVAHWYYGGSMPSRPQTWWHSKSLWDQVLWLCFAGFALVVILSIVKHLGWYE
jgi:hypothetical protein